METISSRPAVSWHFDFNATSMIRGEKRKIHDGKLVPISCFSCKTAHFALPQIFPYWQPLDGIQQDAPPPPNSWQNWGEQWDSDRTPVMKWFPEPSRSSVHFLYVLFCAFFSPLNTRLEHSLALFPPSTGGMRAKSFSVSLRICFCYFFSPFRMKQWVCISGSRMVSQLFFFLFLRAGKLKKHQIAGWQFFLHFFLVFF